MIKSNYKEGLYYSESLKSEAERLQKNIVSLLSENHGVGIIGGYYRPDFPICIISELALLMLGFTSYDEFERITGATLAGIVKNREKLDEIFSKSSGTYELYLRGKSKDIRVRFVKHDMASYDSEILWIASVCDIDAFYNKSLQLDKTIKDRQHSELIQRAKTERTNKELTRQKRALEHALFEAELNNEIISAIGKIYWLIYRLDIPSGTFEKIAVEGDTHKLTGENGITAKRFPEACKENIAPEYLDEMLKFIDMDTLSDRLSDREEISHEYKTLTGNWHTARFIVQKRDSSGKVIKALYTL